MLLTCYVLVAILVGVVAPSPWVALAVVPHAALLAGTVWSIRAARRERATGELMRFHVGCAVLLGGTWVWSGILIGFLAWPAGS